ncbi:MAG: hypothetical protein IPM57_05895 [Oligoflexia bacterium]|nr:hypothetical protein [Oligoflexia bacterium]
MFKLFTLVSLITLLTAFADNAYAQENKYEPNKFYITLKYNTPDERLPHGIWSTSWTIGSNIVNGDNFVESTTPFIEESIVLVLFSKVAGRVFSNHNELFEYLRSVNKNSKELSALVEATKELFGFYAVGTLSQHGALSFRNGAMANDPTTRAIIKKMSPKDISNQFEIAHQFDLLVCGQLLAKLK